MPGSHTLPGSHKWTVSCRPTAFCQWAAALDADTRDGLGMLVAQGVIGIEYWTGKTPDPAVMRGGLEAVFGS